MGCVKREPHVPYLLLCKRTLFCTLQQDFFQNFCGQGIALALPKLASVCGCSLDAVADHFLISSESAAGSMHQNHSFFRAAAKLWQEAVGAALLE